MPAGRAGAGVAAARGRQTFPAPGLSTRKHSGEAMPPTELDLLKGTLDVLVLKTLSWGPRHGYAVARWIRETSDAAIQVEDRALYVALHRLEARGWLLGE